MKMKSALKFKKYTAEKKGNESHAKKRERAMSVCKRLRAIFTRMEYTNDDDVLVYVLVGQTQSMISLYECFLTGLILVIYI